MSRSYRVQVSRVLLAFGLWTWLVACDSTAKAPAAADVTSNASPDAASDIAQPSHDWNAAGPHPAGHVHLQLSDPQSGRSLPVTLWYPADPSAAAQASAGVSAATFLPEGPTRTALQTLLDAAPAGCTVPKVSSAPDAAPAATGGWPLVVFSHCHGCTRFSAHSLAVRLASHGIAVAAPDHVGNTRMEAQAGVTAPLNGTFLQVRGRDVRFVLDALLDAAGEALPAPLRGKLDPAKVGAMGHSFGSVTTGLVAQQDPRVRAAFCLAAPIDNPLLPGVHAAQVNVPIGFVLAREDNSISELGNQFLQQNYAEVPGPAWLIELVDAGHWSFTDVAGLVPAFAAGCGEGYRMSDGVTAFTYLDPQVARSLVARHAAAFFGLHLLGDASARTALEAAESPALETVVHRP